MLPVLPDQPLRALIYCRASADPTGRGLSVAAQERENRARCEREGWVVAGVIVDNDRSASRFAKKQREGYERAKRAIAGLVFGRVDVLVAVESSRAVRDLEAFAELRRLCAENRVLVAYGARLADMTRGDDRFVAGIDALVDERYAEEARDRTKRGHQTSVANRTPRSFAPYGYRRTYHERTGRLVGQEPDPETAPVVQEIVRRILAGDTLYSIAQSLDDADVPTPQERLDRWKGRTGVERAGWSSSMLRNLLSKQSLMGIRTYRGQAVGQGTWEPIVSPGDWRRVQAVLGERRNTGHDTRSKYLLSGIATCGPCGAWLRPLTNRGRGTYVCAGIVPTAPKGHVSRSRDPLDAFVSAVVVSRLQRPDALEVFQPRLPPGHGQEAERQLADVRARLAEFEESAARGGISPGAFERIEARLLGEIRDLEARLVPVELPPVVREVAGVDAPQRWQALSLPRKRQLLRALCAVRVHRATRAGVRGFDVSSVEVTWLSPT